MAAVQTRTLGTCLPGSLHRIVRWWWTGIGIRKWFLNSWIFLMLDIHSS